MSSSIEKQFGGFHIFGEYPDGCVDLVWSSYSEEYNFDHIEPAYADEIIYLWDNLLQHTEKLSEKAWKYDELQVAKGKENNPSGL